MGLENIKRHSKIFQVLKPNLEQPRIKINSLRLSCLKLERLKKIVFNVFLKNLLWNAERSDIILHLICNFLLSYSKCIDICKKG